MPHDFFDGSGMSASSKALASASASASKSDCSLISFPLFLFECEASALDMNCDAGDAPLEAPPVDEDVRFFLERFPVDGEFHRYPLTKARY